MCNTTRAIHLNCCLREICLVWVILTYITGTKPTASGEHQAEVKLILMCYQQCLVDFSVVGQGNTRMFVQNIFTVLEMAQLLAVVELSIYLPARQSQSRGIAVS